MGFSLNGKNLCVISLPRAASVWQKIGIEKSTLEINCSAIAAFCYGFNRKLLKRRFLCLKRKSIARHDG